MTDSHARARQVVIALLADGVAPVADAEWLEGHLRECPPCSALREDLRAGVRVLRLPEVTADRALVQATQRRLHGRARELAETRRLDKTLLAVVLLGLLSSIATATGLLRELAMLATRVGVSAPVAVAVGVAIWFLPASLAALVGLLLRPPLSAGVEVEVES